MAGSNKKCSVLLVCSAGGHLMEMLTLEPAYSDCDTTWVTLPGADVDHLLQGREVELAHGPTNRSILNLLRNLRVAWRVIRRRRPDVILSTGAGIAVPFFVVGRLFGCRQIYVESLTRTQGLSMTGKLAYPFIDEVFVQWPVQQRRNRLRHAGSLL
jgi:beta-1,4-N-acetylglucosaminyltransferase